MYANGKAKIIPSVLSSKPPWPGIIDPVFFFFDFLLKKEIIKSPIWLTVDISNININSSLPKWFGKSYSIKKEFCEKKYTNIIDSRYPPIEPA